MSWDGLLSVGVSGPADLPGPGRPGEDRLRLQAPHSTTAGPSSSTAVARWLFVHQVPRGFSGSLLTGALPPFTVAEN